MSIYAAIRAVASYLPETVEKNDTENPIVRKLGIEERHIAGKDEAASDLAIGAAKNLFAAYGIAPESIDFVLLCTQHPDYQMPTTACHVQSELGIPQTAGALDYGLGCSGYPYGLGLAKDMPRDNPEVVEEDAQGNHRSNYEVHMDGAAITFFSMRTVPPLVKSVLTKAGLTAADLDGCIFHQANHYMLEKLRTRCGLDDVPFFNDIQKTGNIVSGSVPLALDTISKEGKLVGRHHVLLAGFGVGLSWSGCVADFGALMKQKG